MNTTRMDSLLSRLKQSLVTDVLFALVVAIALVIYLLGLVLGTRLEVTPAPRDTVEPQAVPGPVEHAQHRAPGNDAWLC